ncbi:MAG: MarR family transcriptional regulator [Planctomycetota bacterium]|nr:MarR family transcriptional regulator [Planctomycetota bacterium]
MARSVLQDEIKKSQPFDTLEEEALLNLVRTSDVCGLEFARLFRTRGLSPPLYNILRILRGVGGDGLPCLEIASRMLACAPDITRLIDRLEQSGLVVRDRSRTDRRVVNVRIIEQGLALLAELDAPVRALHTRMIGHLSREELTELSRLLVKARYSPAASAGSLPTGVQDETCLEDLASTRCGAEDESCTSTDAPG